MGLIPAATRRCFPGCACVAAPAGLAGRQVASPSDPSAWKPFTHRDTSAGSAVRPPTQTISTKPYYRLPRAVSENHWEWIVKPLIVMQLRHLGVVSPTTVLERFTQPQNFGRLLLDTCLLGRDRLLLLRSKSDRLSLSRSYFISIVSDSE